MRFWLAAFIVLFAAVELLNWITQVSSWHASGVWLVLGGMGLAAVSNWKVEESAEDNAAETETVAKLSQQEENFLESINAKAATSVVDRSEDTISFKVRPLKQ